MNERLEKLGLLAGGVTTPEGEAFLQTADAVDDPNMFLDLYEKGFMDAAGKTTLRGRAFSMDQGEAVRDGFDTFRLWKETGGEGAWRERMGLDQERNFGEQVGGAVKEIAGLVPKAVRGYKDIAQGAFIAGLEKLGMRGAAGILSALEGKTAGQKAAAGEVATGEYLREGARSPVMIQRGLGLVGAKQAAKWTGNDAVLLKAEFDFLKANAEIDDIETAELMALAANPTSAFGGGIPTPSSNPAATSNCRPDPSKRTTGSRRSRAVPRSASWRARSTSRPRASPGLPVRP